MQKYERLERKKKTKNEKGKEKKAMGFLRKEKRNKKEK